MMEGKRPLIKEPWEQNLSLGSVLYLQIQLLGHVQHWQNYCQEACFSSRKLVLVDMGQ